MSKIRLSAALVLFFVSLNFFSQAQILYKVEVPDSKKVSYILGTHHFAPVSVLDSIWMLEEVFENTEKFYGELDMKKMTDPEVMMSVQSKLIAPADSTLDRLLTKAQLDSVRSVWDEFTEGAIPLDMLMKMKPSLISTQLASMMAMKYMPETNPLEGIDMKMQNIARKYDIPVAGLETIDFQFEMLYGQPLARQAELLMETIRNKDEEADNARQLSEDYMAGRLDKILEKMIETEGKDTEMAERLIYSRNDNWVKQLKEMMPLNSLLVVVGAGHLPGDRGILQGLRNAGFTVSPVY